MLNIKPPDYQFCPFCGKKLKTKIQEERERKFCDFCHWTHYPCVATASAGVLVRKDKVLLVKRNREPYKNTWMFPAGFVELGEHPEEAVKREFKEETGLNVTKAKFMAIYQANDDFRNPGHFVFFYKVCASGNKIKTDKNENQDIGWFDINTPPKIGWKWHKHMIKTLQNGNFLR